MFHSLLGAAADDNVDRAGSIGGSHEQRSEQESVHRLELVRASRALLQMLNVLERSSSGAFPDVSRKSTGATADTDTIVRIALL